MTPHFLYSRHFFLLACAVGLIMVIDRVHLFAEPFVPTFALNGMLHAVTLAGTARERQPLWRRCAFVAVAATLSVLTFYIGRVVLHALSGLPFSAQVYYVLGVCAGTGAITYGFLIRTFWLPNIAPRAILAIAMGCALATCAALFIRSFFYGLDGWWLASAWWFAFSGGLWYCDTHPTSARQ